MSKDKEKEENEGNQVDKKFYCPECGSVLKPNALFCERCGEKIPESVWIENSSSNPGNPGSLDKENDNNPENNDDEKKKKKKKNKNNDDDDEEEEEADKRMTFKLSPEGLKMRQSSEDDEQTVRLNISIPDSKRKEWKRLAANLGESVSELVRNAMGALQAGITGAESLENFGERMEHWGKTLEKSLEQSGITKMGEKIGKKVEKKVGKMERKFEQKFGEKKYTKEDLERLKKRVEGLIKLQKSIPIEKLAQILEMPDKDAENIIYELVAEGIEGTLEERVFKFISDSDSDLERAITKLNEIIDRMK
jgi:hypothetical protein